VLTTRRTQTTELAKITVGRHWEQETALRVMIAYVAHELNHPLGTIINLANMLSRRLTGPVVRPNEIGEHLKVIKAEADRATSIIKHMRVLTEHKPAARESVSLTNICRDTITRIKPLATSKLVKIRFEARPPRARVLGVKELLGTALYNLAINGIAALDDPALDNRQLTIRIANEVPNWTTIQILDNGIGVPEAIRDKIFDPFVTTRADGSGLGLAIAGDIVRWHHGYLSCRPRKSGTCMEIMLPQE
jgi:two-component system, LuxR family, sensor kinase FixL